MKCVKIKIVLICLVVQFASGFAFSPKSRDYCDNYDQCDCLQPVFNHYHINCPKKSLGATQLFIETTPHVTTIKCAFSHTNITEHLPAVHEIRTISSVKIENCALSPVAITEILSNTVSYVYLRGLTFKNVTNLNSEVMKGFTLDHVYIENTDLRDSLSVLNSLKALRSLVLENTNVTSLNNIRISKLVKLESYENKIAAISRETFANIRSLETLQIRGSNIEGLGDDTFRDLNLLITLTIGSDRLRNISSNAFASMTFLKFLRLDNTNKTLPTLPDALFMGLRTLFKLEVKCGLTAINNGTFDGMRKLMALSLSDNYLEDIPADFLVNLPNLLTLNLSHNSIESLDDNMFTPAPRLNIIDLSHNNLKTWNDKLLRSLTMLLTIRLNNNQLTNFFYNGREGAAYTIMLNDNQLNFTNQKECPIIDTPRFHRMSLNLANNQIDNLQSLQCLLNNTNVVNINLTNNYIDSINEADFDTITKTEKRRDDITLLLQNNLISSIEFWEDHTDVALVDSDEITDLMGAAVKLEISGNPIVCDDCGTFNKIRDNKYIGTKFNYYGTKIEFAMQKTECLQTLYCSFEDIYKQDLACPEKCWCTVRKGDKHTLIKCVDAQLKKLPTLPQYENKYVGDISLDVSRNNIKDLIFDEPNMYAKITGLNLEHNNISNIVFQHFPKNIKSLKLAHNDISQLDNSHIAFLNNRGGELTVTLAFNSWICQTANFDFSQLQKETNYYIEDAADMKCKPQMVVKDAGMSSVAYFFIWSFVVILIAVSVYFVYTRYQLPAVMNTALSTLRRRNTDMAENLI